MFTQKKKRLIFTFTLIQYIFTKRYIRFNTHVDEINLYIAKENVIRLKKKTNCQSQKRPVAHN